MQDRISELFDRDNVSAGAATAPAFDAATQRLDPDILSLLQLYLDQSSPIRSIVAVGCHAFPGESGSGAVLLRTEVDRGGLAVAPRFPIQPLGRAPDGVPAHTLDSLGRRARELCGGSAGDDLLLLPAQNLDAMMTPLADEFGFRAVTVLLPEAPAQLRDGDDWKLQRSLFDRGLVAIGSVEVGGIEARCFLTSDAVRSPNRLNGASRGQITMSGLGSNGRFANQLFQYAYVRLYALRHGLTAAVPDWEGRALFDLQDPFCTGVALPQLSFKGFTEDDLLLWEADDPPIDIDLLGYFQEIPECWQSHRPLLRRMFELSAEHQNAVDAWHNELTRGGQRTLVAIHVRRGDYRSFDIPWFRLVPEDWYLDWLRAIWPTLYEPLLHVATDEPDAILPQFNQFELVAGTIGSPVPQLPEHVRDFELLRRADYLAICNSSYSRMAAILAPSTQECFLPSFQKQCFVPYEPWIDPGFWARFADKPPDTPLRSGRQRRSTLIANDGDAVVHARTRPAIFVDVSDLLLYLLYHPTL